MNESYHNIKKLYIIANSFDGNYYEKYEKENLIRYYKSETEAKNYIEKINEYQEEEVNSLSLDENTFFVDVEGPHAIYYYPTQELIQTINNFLYYKKYNLYIEPKTMYYLKKNINFTT